MKKIVIKDNFAFIYLNSGFYNEKAILNTIKIYSDFIDASFSELGKYYIVKIKNKTTEYNLEKLANEFLNYILSIEFELNSEKLN